MMNQTSTTRVRAIKYSDDDKATTYLVPVAHAGRNDRTGAKVHLSQLTIWKASGNVTLGATNCSNNGALRGSLITGDYSFAKVSCKKCGASVEVGEAREAKAEYIEVKR